MNNWNISAISIHRAEKGYRGGQAVPINEKSFRKIAPAHRDNCWYHEGRPPLQVKAVGFGALYGRSERDIYWYIEGRPPLRARTAGIITGTTRAGHLCGPGRQGYFLVR